MDERIQIKLMQVLSGLLPGNDIEIKSTADLRDNPNPDIQDLCETAELIIRLSREERA